MAVPCPHCKIQLQEEEIQRTVTGGAVCPHCQRSLDEPSPNPSTTGNEVAVLGELSADKKYTLEVLDGNEPGRVFALEKPRITIGRRDCDVNLDDPEISRHHASIEIGGTTALGMDFATKISQRLPISAIEIMRLRLTPAAFQRGVSLAATFEGNTLLRGER